VNGESVARSDGCTMKEALAGIREAAAVVACQEAVRMLSVLPLADVLRQARREASPRQGAAEP
jgi:hypothetical protein